MSVVVTAKLAGDELGITVGAKPFNFDGLRKSEPCNERFVFSLVVRSFESEPERLSDEFACW